MRKILPNVIKFQCEKERIRNEADAKQSYLPADGTYGKGFMYLAHMEEGSEA